jgi:hypothetical protein
MDFFVDQLHNEKQHRCVTHFSSNALRNERLLMQWRFGASIGKSLLSLLKASGVDCLC